VASASTTLAEGFDSGLFGLELEVTAEALRTASGRAKLRERDEAAHGALVAALARSHPHLTDPADLDDLARVLTAVSNGAALERLKGPDRMPDELIARLLQAVVRAFSEERPSRSAS